MNQDTAVARPVPAPYLALALQTACHAINLCPDVASARVAMMRNIDRVQRQIVASRAFIGMGLKLVVAPEYFLTGYPLGRLNRPAAIHAARVITQGQGSAWAHQSQPPSTSGRRHGCNSSAKRTSPSPAARSSTGGWVVVIRWRRAASIWSCLLYTSPSPRD